jgi:hypothetical protein
MQAEKKSKAAYRSMEDTPFQCSSRRRKEEGGRIRSRNLPIFPRRHHPFQIFCNTCTQQIQPFNSNRLPLHSEEAEICPSFLTTIIPYKIFWNTCTQQIQLFNSNSLPLHSEEADLSSPPSSLPNCLQYIAHSKFGTSIIPTAYLFIQHSPPASSKSCKQPWLTQTAPILWGKFMTSTSTPQMGTLRRFSPSSAAAATAMKRTSCSGSRAR